MGAAEEGLRSTTELRQMLVQRRGAYAMEYAIVDRGEIVVDRADDVFCGRSGAWARPRLVLVRRHDPCRPIRLQFYNNRKPGTAIRRCYSQPRRLKKK
jgi:hypothetical protein